MMQGIFWKYIRRCAVALLLAAGIFAVGLLSAKRTHGAAVQRTAALHGVEPVSGRSAAPAAGASGPAADDSTRGTAAADKAAGRNQPQVRALPGASATPRSTGSNRSPPSLSRPGA